MNISQSGGTENTTAEEIKRAIGDAVRSVEPTAEVFLFGSRARGDSRRISDYDIMVKTQKKLTLRQLSQIREQLDEIPTLSKIDLVDYNGVSESFRAIALKTSKRLS